MADQFIVAQKGMIKRGKKYLVLKRAEDDETYPGHWDFPGGSVEHHENVKESLEREIFEETKLNVVVKEPVFSFHEFVIGHPVFFLIYECEDPEGEIELSEEHSEYRWAEKRDILQWDIENYLRVLLESTNL